MTFWQLLYFHQFWIEKNHRYHICLKKQSVAALNNKSTFLVFYSSDLNFLILGKESIFYPSIKNLSLPLNLKSHYSCSANDWFSLQKTHLFWRCLASCSMMKILNDVDENDVDINLYVMMTLQMANLSWSDHVLS